MDFIYIKSDLWKALGDHAKREYPYECIGYFEAQRVVPGSVRITKVFPCQSTIRGNARRESARMSKKENKDLISLMHKRDKSKIYGVYHSHPSGHIEISQKDKYWGERRKMFRHQIIVGIQSNAKRTSKAFWYFNTKSWYQSQFIVK